MSGIETGPLYFRRIPYLDVTRAGDHKSIWEINRHQHLVLLAQAYLFSGRQEFLDEIVRQVESWLAQNPFQHGINWASALEVAFRALSWIWVYHLAGRPLRRHFPAAVSGRALPARPAPGGESFLLLFAQHSSAGRSCGAARAGLPVSAVPAQPTAGRRPARGVVRNELDRQVLADGCHFERSTYYHVYALDMFLFHAVLKGLDNTFRDRLTRMAEFLDAVIGARRRPAIFRR